MGKRRGKNRMSKVQWHLEVLQIKDLKEHSKNPRKISKNNLQHLEELIKQFGLIDKPIVNKDLTIIGGHQRIRILKRMKSKTVECWVPDIQLKEEDIDKLCIGLNLNQGEWDYDVLANEWDPLKLLDYGFNQEKLMGTFKEVEESLNEEKNNNKKKKTCPNCGCEF